MRLLNVRVPFDETMEPGIYHDGPCADDDAEGCPACQEEMDEVIEAVEGRYMHRGVLEVMLTNRPYRFEGVTDHTTDPFWEFDVTVRR